LSLKKNVVEFIAFARKPTLIAEDTVMAAHQKLSYVKQLIKFELLLLLVFIPIILLKERFTTAEHVGFGNGHFFYAFEFHHCLRIYQRVI
jgi:hypothetical protein